MLVAGLQVFEEEEFIEPTLKSIYNIFDKIVIGEGCWTSTIQVTGTKRSRDKTIEIIENFHDPLSKIELHHINTESEIAQRNKIWDLCKKYEPTGYWQGDGDEIIHENEVELFKEILNNPKTNSLSPDHYLFWNTLHHYEMWNTGGSRYFYVKDLDLDALKCAINVNWLTYYGQPNFFRKSIPTEIKIWHPSYSKSKARQEMKIGYRDIDDGRKFPHGIVGNKYMSRNPNISMDEFKKWMNSLNKMPFESLPKVLKEHPLAKFKLDL